MPETGGKLVSQRRGEDKKEEQSVGTGRGVHDAGQALWCAPGTGWPAVVQTRAVSQEGVKTSLDQTSHTCSVSFHTGERGASQLTRVPVKLTSTQTQYRGLGGQIGDDRGQKASGFWREQLVQSGTEPPAPQPQDRLCSGAASGSTPLCSHQRSLAPAAGAASCLVAGPEPRLPEPAQPRRSLSPSSPGANSDPRGEKRIPHRSSSIPWPGRLEPRWVLRSSPIAFRRLVLSTLGMEERHSIPGRLPLPQPLLPNFLPRETAQGASSLSSGLGRPGCHSFCFFLLCIGIQHRAGSPAPKPPHPECQAHLV